MRTLELDAHPTRGQFPTLDSISRPDMEVQIMADRRRGSSRNNPTTESNEAPNTEESAVTTAANPEAPAEVPAESTPEESTEGTEGTDGKTEAKKPEVNLDDFKAAVQSAVEESDKTTGQVPEASLASVTTEYRKLEGIKAKNQAKHFVAQGMKDAMNSGDLGGARAWLNIQDDALVAAAATKAERAPADPTEAFVQRLVTLRLADHLATLSVPEGVDEAWGDKVSEKLNELGDTARTYFEWVESEDENKGDEPDVPNFVKAAAKLATGKTARAGSVRVSTAGAGTGERHDIGKHILNAFANVEPGKFLTIAEIRNTRSDEYGDNPPSAGAISARLFPKDKDGNPKRSSMEDQGIKPDQQNGRMGAYKTEDAA